MIKITFNECNGVVKEKYTSNVSKNGASAQMGLHPFEVNTRSVYADRGIGIDHVTRCRTIMWHVEHAKTCHETKCQQN